MEGKRGQKKHMKWDIARDIKEEVRVAEERKCRVGDADGRTKLLSPTVRQMAHCDFIALQRDTRVIE